MLPSGSILDFIARVTSLPRRETESPALRYGVPLESFWKYSSSLLSYLQSSKLKEVMNNTIIEASFITIVQGLFSPPAFLACREVFGGTPTVFGADAH